MHNQAELRKARAKLTYNTKRYHALHRYHSRRS